MAEAYAPYVPADGRSRSLALTGADLPAAELSSSKTRLSGIEALRGLAAVAVVAFHASRHVNKAFGTPGLAALFEPGQAGVDLFFTLSGFIILHVHRRDIGQPARLAHYLGRRLTRVMPLYWLALAATIVMSVAGSHTMPSPGRLLLSAFLLPGQQPPLLGVAWSLQFEMLFYAMFALLILNRMFGMIAIAAWLLCVACSACGVALAILPPQVSGIYGVEFFLGMASAQILHTVRISKPYVVVGVGVCMFVISAALCVRLVGEFGVPARLMYGASASLIVLGLAAMDEAGGTWVPRWARKIGSASYAIYLFQFVFIGSVWEVVWHSGLYQRVSPLVLFFVLSASALSGGVLTASWVEKPILRRLRN